MTMDSQHTDRPRAGGEPEPLIPDRWIDEDLFDRIHGDPRLESGVPEEMRGNDLEFIQMTGLTRPDAVAPHAPSVAASPCDEELARPISFYEKGVADVDGEEDDVLGSSPLETSARSFDASVSSPIEDLRTIISRLTEELTQSAAPMPEPLAEPMPSEEALAFSEPFPQEESAAPFLSCEEQMETGEGEESANGGDRFSSVAECASAVGDRDLQAIEAPDSMGMEEVVPVYDASMAYATVGDGGIAADESQEPDAVALTGEAIAPPQCASPEAVSAPLDSEETRESFVEGFDVEETAQGDKKPPDVVPALTGLDVSPEALSPETFLETGDMTSPVDLVSRDVRFSSNSALLDAETYLDALEQQISGMPETPLETRDEQTSVPTEIALDGQTVSSEIPVTESEADADVLDSAFPDADLAQAEIYLRQLEHPTIPQNEAEPPRDDAAPLQETFAESRSDVPEPAPEMPMPCLEEENVAKEFEQAPADLVPEMAVPAWCEPEPPSEAERTEEMEGQALAPDSWAEAAVDQSAVSSPDEAIEETCVETEQVDADEEIEEEKAAVLEELEELEECAREDLSGPADLPVAAVPDPEDFASIAGVVSLEGSEEAPSPVWASTQSSAPGKVFTTDIDNSPDRMQTEPAPAESFAAAACDSDLRASIPPLAQGRFEPSLEDRDADDLGQDLPTRRAMYRRRSKALGGGRRKIVRYALWTAMALVCLGAMHGGMILYRGWTATPEGLFSQASVLTTQGRYEEAADLYLDLCQRYPDHPRRADAEFNAAAVLQMDPRAASGRQREMSARSLTLFEAFLKNHPSDPRAARTQGLMGILHFRLGNHAEAVRILSNPDLRESDPVAELPMLRMLAQAQAALGDLAAAKATCLLAIASHANINPEQDRITLGALCEAMAEQSPSDADRKTHWNAAMDEYARALQVSGISPGVREQINAKMKGVRSRLAALAKPPETTTPAVDTAPATPVEAEEETPEYAKIPAIDPEESEATAAAERASAAD